MLKKNWLKTIISCLFTLSPITFGLIMWDKLPKMMATHWGVDGTADGMSSRGFAVFALPLILLVINIFAIFISAIDKKNKNQNTKAYNMVYYIMPITSIFTSAIMYATAFNKIWDYTAIFPIFLGLIFAIMGNVTPKIRQNTTLGIKLKWTLQSEANWNATHRFGGKVMFIAGLLILLTAFLPVTAMLITSIAAIFATLIITAVYSYFYYKKEVANNTKFEPVYSVKTNKIATIITLIAIPLVLIGIAFIMFTGNVTVKYNNKSFTVDSEYYDALTINYEDVETIEICENVNSGNKEFGFNSAKLSLGRFKNKKYGSHTRYTYNSCDTVIVMEIDGKTLIINGKTKDETMKIYNKIQTNVSSIES